MNRRIDIAGKMLANLDVKSVLDVGCRDCEARSVIPAEVEYFGNDLFQNKNGNVVFIGDVLTINFMRSFDCVMALDVVEHVDNPYELMEKLISLCDKYLLVSLPNIYDVRHKYDFLFKNSLGGKYAFGIENRLDRHRWIMNYDEIHRFYAFYARKHSMSLTTQELTSGAHSRSAFIKCASKLLSLVVGQKTLTRTIIGLFSK